MVIPDEKLYDVIYLIESTIANGHHYENLKSSYLLPSIRYFNGGAQPVETDWLGADNNGTQYCLLLFHNKLKFGYNVTNEGVTRNPYKFSSQLNNLKLANGSLSDCSLMGEGLAAALQSFDDLAKKRENSLNVVKHLIIVGHLPPFTIPVLGNGAYTGYSFDKILDTINKKSINLSVISGRIVNQFKDLIKRTSPSDAHNIISKSNQYSIDPKHMVYLKGFHMPVDTGTLEMASNAGKRNTNDTNDLNATKVKVKKLEEGQNTLPLNMGAQQTSKSTNSLPQQPFIHLQQPGNSLVNKSPLRNTQTSQLQSQTTRIGPFPNQQGTAADALVKMADKINKSSNVPLPNVSLAPAQPYQQIVNQPGVKLLPPQQQLPPQQHTVTVASQVQHPAQLQQSAAQQPERKLAWTGQLQWQETTVSGNEPGKSISRDRTLPCHATIAASETLKTDVWPSTLQMQLIPQTYLNTLNRFLKSAKTVQFQFSQSDGDVLQAMYRVMNGGHAVGNPSVSGQKFAGCVILNPPSPPNPNHVHVLLLLYSARKKTFMGVIPEEQQTFVNELGAIINADKNRAKHQQQNLTGQQQVRPQRPVAPIMNPQITSTNQQLTANQISAPQLIARQMPTNQNSALRSLLTNNSLQQQLQQQQQPIIQQQQQIALQQQQQLQPQLQPQQASQQVPQQVPQQVVGNPINWRNQLMLQQNPRFATAMAIAQQQQQQQQQTQLNDAQIFGDYLNPVTMNSLQQQ